jgi:hypothetical protein
MITKAAEQGRHAALPYLFCLAVFLVVASRLNGDMISYSLLWAGVIGFLASDLPPFPVEPLTGRLWTADVWVARHERIWADHPLPAFVGYMLVAVVLNAMALSRTLKRPSLLGGFVGPRNLTDLSLLWKISWLRRSLSLVNRSVVLAVFLVTLYVVTAAVFTDSPARWDPTDAQLWISHIPVLAALLVAAFLDTVSSNRFDRAWEVTALACLLGCLSGGTALGFDQVWRADWFRVTVLLVLPASATLAHIYRPPQVWRRRL